MTAPLASVILTDSARNMAIQTNIHEAKTHLSRLLEQAHRGEDVIIAKDGKPYARLVPIRTAARRVPGAFRGLITGDVLGPMGPVDADWG